MANIHHAVGATGARSADCPGAAEPKRIKIGPGGFLLPYHHPAELANRIAMLDHLSEGRLLFGVAASGLASDWAMFDVDGTTGAHQDDA